MLLRLETFEGAILAAQKVQLFLAVRFLQEEEFVPTSVFSCFYEKVLTIEGFNLTLECFWSNSNLSSALHSADTLLGWPSLRAMSSMSASMAATRHCIMSALPLGLNRKDRKTVMKGPKLPYKSSKVSLVAIFAHVLLTSLPERGREVPILHCKDLPMFYGPRTLPRHPLHRVSVLGLEFDETPHQATLFHFSLNFIKIMNGK